MEFLFILAQPPVQSLGLLHVARYEQKQILQLIELTFLLYLQCFVYCFQSLLIVLVCIPVIEQKSSVVVPVSG